MTNAEGVLRVLGELRVLADMNEQEIINLRQEIRVLRKEIEDLNSQLEQKVNERL